MPMSFTLTYADAMNRLAELAQPDRPAYTRLQALTTLVRELSPANPRHDDIVRALKPAPSPDSTFPDAPLTPRQQKDFHLHPVEADLAAPTHAEDAPLADDEGSPEEEDDPW